MTFWIIYLIVQLGVSAFLYSRLIYKQKEFKGEEKTTRIAIYLICFLPIISISVLLIFFGLSITCIISNITKKFKDKRELKRYLKERDLKIKLGIIKITPSDPYGEEIWD